MYVISSFEIPFYSGRSVHGLPSHPKAQMAPTNTDTFGSRMRYGGGLSLSFGNDAFLIGVSPQAIYQVNNFLAVGAGLNYTYSKVGKVKPTLWVVVSLPLQIRWLPFSSRLNLRSSISTAVLAPSANPFGSRPCIWVWDTGSGP